MLAEVHWQAGDRPLPVPKVTVAGESVLMVDHRDRCLDQADVVCEIGRASCRERV